MAAVMLLCQGSALASDGSHRKKVAVVLSGGGAKGMAHIGALRVIEKAGIPIDIITGTSMGAIVGGLYAIGYDAHRLDSMVSVQDWSFLLTDKLEAHSPLLDNRERQNTYFLSKTFMLLKSLMFWKVRAIPSFVISSGVGASTFPPRYISCSFPA